MTISANTFVELLRSRAVEQAKNKAYIFLSDGESEEIPITYGELDRQARAIAATLQQWEGKGERALLLFPPGLEFISAFFGSLYAGGVAVPVYPPDPFRLKRSLPRLQTIIQDARAKFVVTTQQILSLGESLLDEVPELKEMQWIATDTLKRGAEENWREPSINRDTLAFLQYTSGSTGTPKGVMISHGNLINNAQYIHHVEGTPPHRTGVFWLPLYHDMGLIGGVLQPLYYGDPSILLSPLDFLQRPMRWLQAISRYRATHSAAPNFAYDLCVRKITPDERSKLDLSSWCIAYNGAEPIRKETLDRFCVAFEPCGFRRNAFYPVYGLAEATLLVSSGLQEDTPVCCSVQGDALKSKRIKVSSPDAPGARSLVSSGRPHLDTKFVIVDPNSQTRCAPDEIGEIWVSGKNVARGYWNRPQETKEIFQAFLQDPAEGPFLRTGDLGFIKEGELYITGRLKEMIIIRGQNYYPQDIEHTVEKSHPALRPGCGAVFSIERDGEERLVLVHEVDNRRKFDIHEVVAAIQQSAIDNYEIRIHHVVLIEPKSLPKTSSGKIQRHECRNEFLAGTLQVWKGVSDLDLSHA